MLTTRASSRPCPGADIASFRRSRRQEPGNLKRLVGTGSQSYHQIVRTKWKTPFRPSRFPGRRVLPWAVAGVLAVVGVIAYWRPWRPPAIIVARPFLQLVLDTVPDQFG